jgi:hypothetical protein
VTLHTSPKIRYSSPNILPSKVPTSTSTELETSIQRTWQEWIGQLSEGEDIKEVDKFCYVTFNGIINCTRCTVMGHRRNGTNDSYKKY